MAERARCRAVFLDAGGVLVLPRRELIAEALGRAGWTVDAAAVPGAHYAAVRRLDRGERTGYFEILCAELGVAPSHRPVAVAELERLGDRRRSGRILWSEPGPAVVSTIGALSRAGITVVVVSNSDGHAAENLRAAGVCQLGSGTGAPVAGIIDSTVVGVEKPDRGIFQIALRCAKVPPDAVVHVGDMLSTDVAGARAAGIEPVHFDPYRACRDRGHRHIRSLPGIWHHVQPLPARLDRGRSGRAESDRL